MPSYDPPDCSVTSYSGDCTITCSGYRECVSASLQRTAGHGNTILICEEYQACVSLTFNCDDPSKCYVTCRDGDVGAGDDTPYACLTLSLDPTTIRRCCKTIADCQPGMSGTDDDNCYDDASDLALTDPSPPPPAPSPPPSSPPPVCTTASLDYYPTTGMYAKEASTWRGYQKNGDAGMDILLSYGALPSKAAVQAAETAAGVNFCPACSGSSESEQCGKLHTATDWEGDHLHLKEKEGDDDPCIDDSTSAELGARVRFLSHPAAPAHPTDNPPSPPPPGPPTPMELVNAGVRLLLRFHLRVCRLAVLPD